MAGADELTWSGMMPSPVYAKRKMQVSGLVLIGGMVHGCKGRGGKG
jgi:hypothetical protein